MRQLTPASKSKLNGIPEHAPQALKTYYWKSDEFELLAIASSPAEARQLLRMELDTWHNTSFQTVRSMAMRLINCTPTSIHFSKVGFIVLKEQSERINRYIHSKEIEDDNDSRT